MKRGYVYIMTNSPSGTLYIGVTSDLSARIHQHRTGTGTGSDFCKRHRLTRLVHVETFDTMLEAITREKQLKSWQGSWKLNLIGRTNPDWTDLSDHLPL